MDKKPLNKERANANMYYNLFADKIGKFNNNENVLLIHIGNFDVISKFIVNNMNCNYFIIDRHLKCNYLKLNFPQIHFFGSKEDEGIIEVLEQIDMKFDKIIMNPPYSRDLHLKVLAKTLKHLCEDGECVNLSPCEWMARPYLKKTWEKQFLNYEDSIGKYIEDLKIIENFNEIFGDTQNDILVGIYKLSKSGGFDYKNFYKTYDTNLLDAYSKFKSSIYLKDKLVKFSDQKYFVPLRKDAIMERWWRYKLINYLDIVVDGKIFSGQYKGCTIYEARSKNPHENPRNYNRDTFGISFDSLNEAINFRNSLNLEVYLYIISKIKLTRGFPLNKLPFLNDYKISYTNEDLYKMFEIKEDLDIIVKEMKPYVEEDKNFQYPWKTNK
jgi:hypothetical protein